MQHLLSPLPQPPPPPSPELLQGYNSLYVLFLANWASLGTFFLPQLVSTATFVILGKTSPGQQDVIPSSAQYPSNLSSLRPPQRLLLCWPHASGPTRLQNAVRKYGMKSAVLISLIYRIPSFYKLKSYLPSSSLLITEYCVITEYLV